MTRRVEIRSGDWSSGPVEVVRSRRDRRLGLRRAIDADGLALKARSVHTFGMTRDISVIACDHNARVVRTKRLPPRRVFFTPGAALIIETFIPEFPRVGDSVDALDRRPATGNRQPGTGNRQPATGDG